MVDADHVQPERPRVCLQQNGSLVTRIGRVRVDFHGRAFADDRQSVFACISDRPRSFQLEKSLEIGFEKLAIMDKKTMARNPT